VTDYAYFAGQSGTVHAFEVNALGVAYRPIPGVYIFMRPTLGQWEPLYVGEPATSMIA
jgi:hypothetical protein